MATKHVLPVNPRMEYWAKPASTPFAEMDAVAGNEDATDNTFDAMGATSANIAGFINQEILATDSDYASETKVGLLVDEDGVFQFDVDTGTADANDEGGFIDADDTAPDDAVDVTASTEDHYQVTSFISGTLVQGRVAVWSHRQPPVIR